MMDYVGQRYMLPVEHLNPLTMQRFIDEIMAGREEIAAVIRTHGEAAAEKAEENAAYAIELLEK